MDYRGLLKKYMRAVEEKAYGDYDGYVVLAAADVTSDELELLVLEELERELEQEKEAAQKVDSEKYRELQLIAASQELARLQKFKAPNFDRDRFSTRAAHEAAEREEAKKISSAS